MKALRRASPNEAIDAQQYHKATRRNRRAHAAASRAYANAADLGPTGYPGTPLLLVNPGTVLQGGGAVYIPYFPTDRKV